MVFDAVGKSSFGRWRRLLEPRGVYLSTDLGRPASAHGSVTDEERQRQPIPPLHSLMREVLYKRLPIPNGPSII